MQTPAEHAICYHRRPSFDEENPLLLARFLPVTRIPAGSHAKFITEHYWGYACFRGGCSEYRVEHPRWKFWNADSFEFSADVGALYGEQFVEPLSLRPHSAFIADGSPIQVLLREQLP